MRSATKWLAQRCPYFAAALGKFDQNRNALGLPGYAAGTLPVGTIQLNVNPLMVTNAHGSACMRLDRRRSGWRYPFACPTSAAGPATVR